MPSPGYISAERFWYKHLILKFDGVIEMKYLALLPFVFLACGGVDSADGNGTGGVNNGGTGNVVSLGGSVSGGAGGVNQCDPDQHCHGGNGGSGGVTVTGGTNTGGNVSGGSVNTGGVVSTGGVSQTGGTVSTGGMVNEGGSAGQGGDDNGGSGGCNNTCDDDYTVCKVKCYKKQCSHSVRWECLCDCKKVHEECKASSCDPKTHTCTH